MATDTTEDTTTESTGVSDAIDALLAEEGVEPTTEPEATPEVDEDSPEPAEPEQEPEAEEAADDAGDLSALAEEAVAYYGLSKAEVEQAGDSLPWILARLDRQASLLMQGQPGQDDPLRESESDPPQREPEKKREPLADLDAFDLLIDREDFDEGSLKVFDALKAEINKQRSTINEHRQAMQMLAQLTTETHKTAADLRQRTESASTTEFASSMDDFFAKLPDEYVDIYGREPMSRLSQNSPMVAARNALVSEMSILAGFDAKGGRPARGIKEQAARTLRALHADKAHVAARREVDKQLKSHRQKGIAKPSGRTNAKHNDIASRRARAMTAMDKILPRLGL